MSGDEFDFAAALVEGRFAAVVDAIDDRIEAAPNDAELRM